MKILVVEDERELLESIAEGLRLSGYAVDTADNGNDAEEMGLVNAYDLVVLDINLPGMDGFSVLESIRSENKTVSIIMLTARGDVTDRVKGLDLGANDYMVKPFHFAELEARIRSLLRRRQVQEELVLTSHSISFDTKTKQASIDGTPLHLTGKETGILEYLMMNQGRYVTQEELLEHVWEDGMNEFSNTVRVHVSSLRKKLKKAAGISLIGNEIGRGYIIDKE
jgi:DNA-binding response OmpR family regulator